jgi:membrane-associated phospholipid phosphatase
LGVIAWISAGLATAPRAALAAPPSAADPAVYDVSPWVDGAVIVGSNLITLGLYGFGSGLVHHSCPCDPARVNAFDRPTIGNHNDTAYDVATVTVGASAVVPLALDALDLRELRPVVEDATILAEAMSVTGAIATVTKYAVQRPFPRTYAGAPALLGSVSGYRSFFSGHTAQTFCALSVTSMTVGRRYGIHVVPWIVTVVVGASVAAGVVLGGWHFPTDTIAGAVVGTGVGVAVPILHFSDASMRPVVTVGPDGAASVGLVGTWR